MSSIPLDKAAYAESKRLDHHWVGPQHGLLAILRGDAEDVARLALEEAGLDADWFERWYLERLERSDPKPERKPESEGVSPNPAWYTVSGRAEGFAGGLGTGEVRPVDLLLALLWDNREWIPVRELGISREAIVENLVRLGVTLPAAPMPDLDRPWTKPQRVDFPKSALDRVIGLLIQRHPPGSGLRWGINHDGAERAWAFAEEGIDLQGVVDQALTSGD